MKITSLVCMLIFGTLIVFPQEIINKNIINNPSLGNRNTYMLGWYMDNKEIKIYTYGHRKGAMAEISEEELKEFKDKVEEEKNYVGKLFASVLNKEGGYKTRVLYLKETILDKELNGLKSGVYAFHSSKNKDPEVKKMFKPDENIVSLDIADQGYGNEILYSVDDLNTYFPALPKLNSTAISYYDAEVEGDGILGMKNIQYWIKHNSAIYKYDVIDKGFETETSRDRLFSLNELSGGGMNLIEGTFNYYDESAMQAWFVGNVENRRDRRNNKLLVFNNKGEIVNDYEYKSDYSKSFIYSDELLEVNNNKGLGFVTIFGYDKRAPKKIRGSEYDSYKLYATNRKGQLINEIDFKYGPSEKHRQYLSPLSVYKSNEDNSIILLNYNIFENNIELLKINSDGVNLLMHKKDKQLFPNYNAFTSNIKSNYKNKYYIGDFNEKKVIIASSVLMAKVKTGEFRGTSTYGNKEVFEGINITILDMEGLKISNKFFPTDKSDEKMRFNLLEKDENICKAIMTLGNKHWFLSVDKEGNVQFELLPIENSEYETNVYTSFTDGQDSSILIDKPNKKAYIMDQLFFKSTLGKTLEKIMITEIAF